MAKVARAARVASRQRVESVSGTKVIESAEAGELYLLTGASTITLPAALDGSYFRFIVGDEFGNSATALVIQTSSSEALQGGVILHKHNTAVTQTNAASGDSATTITVNASSGASNKVVEGTIIECYSDGTKWYLSGMILTEGTVSVAFS